MKNRSILDYVVIGRKSHKPTSSSSPLSQSVEHPSQTQEFNQNEQHETEPSLTPIQEVDQNEDEHEIDPSPTPTQVGNQSEVGSGFMPSQEEQLDVDLLSHDPGKRMPILSYLGNDRDVIRRDLSTRSLVDQIQREISLKHFTDTTNTSGYDPFLQRGYRNWKKALETFEKHVGGNGSFHNEARGKYCFFINQKTSIMEKLDKVSSNGKAIYKARLTYSLQCLRYLLKQGLAFRGHDESATSNNKGNFLELLEWLAGKSENIAKIVLSNAPGNHQATAPTIQKDLIKCCGKETTRLIIEDLDNDLFAILADESSDVSHKEQLAICLRYLDKEGYVGERFLGVVKVDDTSSMTLMATIKKLLATHSLSMLNIRGQGYDGASNMRGELNGLRNLIMRNNPCAYYVHYFAHQLQLTLVAVSKENCECAKFFMHLRIVLNFIASSCKRMTMLKKVQAGKVLKALNLGEIETGRGLNQEIGLSRPGDTRWSSHFNSILSLIALYPSTIEVLEDIGSPSKCVDDRAKAQIALDHLESFEFIFMLHLMKVIFGYTNDLCQALQRKDQDIVNAMTLMDLTMAQLQLMRDDGWDNFLETVCNFCVKKKVEVPNMSDFYAPPGRSRHCLHKVVNLYRYRVEIYTCMIDKQVEELKSRFDEKSKELLKCMACLSPENVFASFNKLKLVNLAEIYPKYFIAVDIMRLGDQLDIYYRYMKNDSSFHNLK
ncbi:uncharacterized protein LOC141590181 [Silene latifolia]|uniref:uncharacterized protein LOC141590181 n=1 Tax=Silene latifolia TaxID=37657 RepID=UPI003D76DEEE